MERDIDEQLEFDYDPHPFISAPLSSQPESQFYTTNIEPVLLETLSRLDINFFFTMTFFNLPISSSETVSAPLIIIYTSSSEDISAIHSALVPIWHQNTAFGRYLVFIAVGRYSMTTTSLPSGVSSYQEIHDDWKCGISIGHKTISATAGAVLEDSNGKFYSLTVAHLFKGSTNNCLGLEITQPSYEDYLGLVAYAKRAKRIYQSRVERLGTGDEEILLKLQTETIRVDQLEATSHDTAEAYHASHMKVARVVKSGYKRMIYNSRPCLLDYALCKLDTRKAEKGHGFFDPLPEGDFLKSLDWASDATEIGTLMYDKYVMKRGRSTGVTYGIVAGVYSVMRHSDTGVRREYWVLPEEKSRSLWEFSKHGDSGALVWTSDGKAVGMVLAGWTVMFDKPPLHMIITPLPEEIWDVGRIPLYRQSDGSLDFGELLTLAVTRPITLIESLQMVMEDIAGEFKLWSP